MDNNKKQQQPKNTAKANLTYATDGFSGISKAVKTKQPSTPPPSPKPKES